MASSNESSPEPDLGPFLERPTDDLSSWAALWESDVVFPIQTHRQGVAGRIVVACKRFVRLFQPLVRAPQADLWQRQRLFNQVLVRHLQDLNRSLEGLTSDVDAIGKDLQQVQSEILGDLRDVQRDINGNVRGLADDLDDFRRKGMADVMRHTDALFARLDQKVDRLRRTTREIAVLPEREDRGA